jgi:hypothetical protein
MSHSAVGVKLGECCVPSSSASAFLRRPVLPGGCLSPHCLGNAVAVAPQNQNSERVGNVVSRRSLVTAFYVCTSLHSNVSKPDCLHLRKALRMNMHAQEIRVGALKDCAGLRYSAIFRLSSLLLRDSLALWKESTKSNRRDRHGTSDLRQFAN